MLELQDGRFDSAQAFATAEQFAREEFQPLLPFVQKAKKLVYQSYVRAGKPLGGGQSNALKWFDGVYQNYQAVSEQADIQETLQEQQAAQEQLLQLGDLQYVDGKLKPTPKGMVRSLVLMGSIYVNTADENGRGLTEQDVMSMKHVLLLTLSALPETGG